MEPGYSMAARITSRMCWMVLVRPMSASSLDYFLSQQAGSGFGFIGGLVSRWRTDVAEALILCQKFPLLIEVGR